MPENWRRGRLYEKWLAFHIVNPQIYAQICQLAQEAIDAGFEHYSIEIIYCTMRHHINISTRGAHNFKFPNNHRACYARLWLEQHPDYPEFFRLCALRSLGEGGYRDEHGLHEEDERRIEFFAHYDDDEDT